MLLEHHASDGIPLRLYTSRKDSFGRAPLFWAATRGHRDVANYKDIIKLLFEKRAPVDGLPTPPGVTLIGGLDNPLQERVKQLLELQEQLFPARYENQSKQVDIAIKILTFSLRFRPVFELVTLYMKHLSLNGWGVLQDPVKNNKTDRLRE
ncbi:hypothetical protein GGR51DRAFT_561706 [Nemania sp. FL0031]|nr:hypothetical protein GGR51DRAFT_561706 [Nemania sp. FL0031]